MAVASQTQFYDDKPRNFISQTTGPKRVGKTLQSHGYEPQVTMFSMCRPVPDLEPHIALDNTGRVCCHLSGMDSYDVWAAFSMSYRTGGFQRLPPPLASAVAAEAVAAEVEELASALTAGL